jgi:hypothetical protein
MAQNGYALVIRRRACAQHMPPLLNGRLRLADNHALDFRGRGCDSTNEFAFVVTYALTANLQSDWTVDDPRRAE